MEELNPKSPQPLYIQLRNILRERIMSGDIEEFLPKELDICHQYKVSRRTASRAVKLLAETGLVTRVKGQGSYINKPAIASIDDTIGVVFPLTDGWSSALRTIRTEAAKIGSIVNFYPYEWFDFNDEKQALLLASTKCNGIILYPNAEKSDKHLIDGLRQKGYPLVLFDLFYEDCDCSFVTMNNFLCASRLTEAIVKSPTDRIAIIQIFNKFQHQTILQRIQGFHQTLKRLNIEFSKKLELELFSFEWKENQQKIFTFIRETKPDGIFITDQNCFPITLLDNKEFRNIRVSTIGQKNNYSSSKCSNLNYAIQPETEIASKAVHLLKEALEDRTTPSVSVFVSPTFHWKHDRGAKDGA